jgi:muramoyltetrapeptide carboxypeptidase
MHKLLNCLRTKKISIISPAGKIKKDLLDKSIAFFTENGINLSIMPHVFDENTQEIYLASSLTNRVSDFTKAWENSDIILCTRGGYGCAELAKAIDWANLKKTDTLVIGYSDVTALHMAMLKNHKGICINGMMALKFPELAKIKLNSTTLEQALQKQNSLDFIDSLSFLQGNSNQISQSTKFITANLAVLSSLCGTELMPEFTNKILIVEDINEAPYKLDRYLTQLLQSGVLAQIKGLIFGEFIECGSEDEINFVFQKFSTHINGIVAKNFPFGHGNNVYSLYSTTASNNK